MALFGMFYLRRREVDTNDRPASQFGQFGCDVGRNSAVAASYVEYLFSTRKYAMG